MANFAIFGCTGGIGLSITQKLLNQGHRIFGVARNLEKLEEIKDALSMFDEPLDMIAQLIDIGKLKSGKQRTQETVIMVMC